MHGVGVKPSFVEINVTVKIVVMQCSTHFPLQKKKILADILQDKRKSPFSLARIA